jgi:hypothetical protein
MNYKKTMSEEQKQKILEKKRVKYETLDQSKKEEVLTKNMSYKKTMGEEQKQKQLENKRAKYQVMDISKKKELIAISSRKIMSNRMSFNPEEKMICSIERNKKGWKRKLKFMTLTCTLISLKNKLKQVHFTYAVCVTEHCIKSQ